MTDQHVFKAVLALDAYNRGYNTGLSALSDATGEALGNATIKGNANDQGGVAQSASFYALAYDWTGDTDMDKYTKTIFTVIAVALAVIAFKLPITNTARALGDGCGDTATYPCYVDYGAVAFGQHGLKVFVTNWDDMPSR